jgi:hypothetical protein
MRRDYILLHRRPDRASLLAGKSAFGQDWHRFAPYMDSLVAPTGWAGLLARLVPRRWPRRPALPAGPTPRTLPRQRLALQAPNVPGMHTSTHTKQKI